MAVLRALGRMLLLSAFLASVSHAQGDEPKDQPPSEEGAGEAAGEGEPQASPEDPEATHRARDHFRRGLEHFKKRAFREAIREFSMAAEAVPSADLWYNIARGHEELSEYEQAIEFYRRYLRDRVDPPDRDQVEQHIAALEERRKAAQSADREHATTGTLRVQSSVDKSAIAVDEREIGRSPIDVPLNLAPGAHALEVSKEGYIPFRSRVTMEAGVTTGAYAELTPATEYRSVRGGRVWTWIVGALAVGAAGASLGLGIKAATVKNDDLSEARDWAKYSDYALGGAIGLGTLAAILWFVEGRSVGTEEVE